jgi:murein DD-endopeptidase MepM/ murein hydrolase activator NlpD
MAPVTIPRQNWAYDPGKNFDAISTYGPRGGKHHSGTDFATKTGTNIPVAANGKIVGRGYNEDYGNWVIVEHKDPKNPSDHVYTTYAHLDNLNSTPPIGSTVQAGQKIGVVGTTGHSEGPHLHMELIRLKPSSPFYSSWPPAEGWKGGATGINGGHGRLDPLVTSNWGGVAPYHASRSGMTSMAPMAEMSPFQLSQQFTKANSVERSSVLNNLSSPLMALRLDKN